MKSEEQKPTYISTKDSTINIFLNIALFFLSAIIIYLLYSIFIKVSGNEVPTKDDNTTASEIIQVEVLNGCGIAGVGERFADYLRNNNFDVVNVSNYITRDISNTIVIDRRGNIANAKKTAKILGIKPEKVIVQLNDDYFVDVTIIVGKDCNILTPLK